MLLMPQPGSIFSFTLGNRFIIFLFLARAPKIYIHASQFLINKKKENLGRRFLQPIRIISCTCDLLLSCCQSAGRRWYREAGLRQEACACRGSTPSVGSVVWCGVERRGEEIRGDQRRSDQHLQLTLCLMLGEGIWIVCVIYFPVCSG